MNKTLFTGSAVALVTPFDDKGVDYDALGRLIDFHIGHKTDALVVCGTTGEAPTLEDSEHLDVIEYTVCRAAKRIPVIAGTGSNNTEHAVMMNREAEKRGADGLLWVSPYYNKTTQKGLRLHYETLAASCDLPAIIYNVPSRTGCDIKPETVGELSKIENICAIKEATGDVSRTVEIKSRFGDRIDVYSGNDDLVVPLISVGAKGVISVLANILPEETHDMCETCLNGNFSEGSKLQLKYYNLIKALFCEVNPIPVKTAMNLMGLPAGRLRLPLCDMNDNNLDYLRGEMEKLCLI